MLHSEIYSIWLMVNTDTFLFSGQKRGWGGGSGKRKQRLNRMKSKTYGSRSRQIKNKLIQLVKFVESLEKLNKTNTKAPCTNRFDNLIKMTTGPPQRFQLLKRKV